MTPCIIVQQRIGECVLSWCREDLWLQFVSCEHVFYYTCFQSVNNMGNLIIGTLARFSFSHDLVMRVHYIIVLASVQVNQISSRYHLMSVLLLEVTISSAAPPTIRHVLYLTFSLSVYIIPPPSCDLDPS